MDNYVGKRFNNRYIIKELIGVGGMAVVYKAYDEIDDKTVAVKVLKDEFCSNEEFKRRFKNESKAIAVLSHPNIVKVYDVNFGEKLQYIVMEYVEGITLKEYIENKHIIELTDAVHFTVQILKALQHAHDKGIIHRDIKPQNIMLLQNGNIKVTDFGIARFCRSDTKTITENGAIGSVHYISPEQARGDYTDEKADLYSVGVVMYEMLTGQLPFQSDSAVSVAIMQLQKNAELPRNINPSVPVGIEQITMRAMQKSPADRYQSAAEMLLDLEEFKRNPNIKFDYGYSVDKQPTKYIPHIDDDIIKNSRQTYKAESYEKEETDNEVDIVENKTKNKTVITLTAVIAVLVIAIGVVSWLFFFKDKNKLIVPDFTGKNITEVIEKYPQFEKYIEKEPVFTSEYEKGIVFEQSVDKGTDLSELSNKVIRLRYADSGSLQQIPQFTKETTLSDYQNQLKALGFNVKLEPGTEDGYKLGQIISVTPAAGTNASVGDIVTVKYSSDDKTVAIPDFTGDNVENAKQQLKTLGFKNSSITFEYEEVTDTTLIDRIINQSVEKSTFVDPSKTVIVLYVGKAVEEKSADCKISLPDLSSYNDTKPRNIQVLNSKNESVYTSSAVLDGSSFKFTLYGKDIQSYSVMIDEQRVCTLSVDYTLKNPKVTVNVLGYNYQTPQNETADIVIPDIDGKTKDEAVGLIKSAGFGNVIVVEISADNTEAGYSISAEGGMEKEYYTEKEALNETVYLYVSKGIG